LIKYLNFNWKNTCIILGFPIILGFILEITVQEISYSTYFNLVENILFSLIVFIIINQLVILKFGRLIVTFVLVIYYFFLFVETGLYLLFQTRISAAYIYVILNTNFNEAKEFSLVYYKENLYWLLLFFTPILRFFPSRIFIQPVFKFKGLLSTFVLLFVFLIVLKYANLAKWNLPYVAVKSHVQYNNQLKEFEDFKNKKSNIQTKTITDNDVVVVVIGESTTRKHMNIYGYSRNTTPKLNVLSDSLLIFNDVISSHVFTTASIYDILTLSNHENPDDKNTLINYLQNAGYMVYWLSNQRPVGLHDNLVSRLASEADESLFLSYNDFRHSTLYDEVLLPKISDKLKEKHKMVIFVHLIGTHYDYKKRYPKSFSEFSSENEKKKNEIIDTYDNAILYNDFIVSEIIKTVDKKSKRSAVIYFSDHGEEVFDVTNYFGHFDDKITSTMYEVPFILFMSSQFEKPDDFIIDKSRKFMLDDFPHSLTHIMGIESELLEKSRSLFSSDFKTRKRFIKDSLEFGNLKFRENNK